MRLVRIEEVRRHTKYINGGQAHLGERPADGREPVPSSRRCAL